MARFHIHPWAKVGSLKNATVMDLTAELSNMKIENDLRREVQDNIRRLKDMGTYRGRRHAMGLPVRGQRTRTQVSELVKTSYTVLMFADCHCTKAEQDRTRWIRANTDVNKDVNTNVKGYSDIRVEYCTAYINGAGLIIDFWYIWTFWPRLLITQRKIQNLIHPDE